MTDGLPLLPVDDENSQFNFDRIAIALGQATGYSAWRYIGATGQPAFENSWVNFDGTRTARFYKDTLGTVWLDGYIKDGSALGTSAFTLPAGYRPGRTIDMACISNTGLHGMATISTTGTVTPSKGATSDFSLSGISFRAEQ